MSGLADVMAQSVSFRRMEFNDGTTMLAQGRESLPLSMGLVLAKVPTNGINPSRHFSTGSSKRTTLIDIEVCGRCGGTVVVIPNALAALMGQALACIEDRDIMSDKAGQALDRIRAHLRDKEQDTPTLAHLAPPTRAPPETLPLFAESESTTTMPAKSARMPARGNS